VMPWLLGILALHAHKLRQRQGRVLDLERLHQPGDSDPEQIAAAAEVKNAVAAACSKLPLAYASIVQRHLVDGIEPGDLAHEFGLSKGNARVRLHRGMKLLRRAMPVAFSSGAYAAGASRGIAAIRTSILERASALTGSPVPAAGFAPLVLLISILAPLLFAVPAWLAWRAQPENAPESIVAAAPAISVPAEPASETRSLELVEAPRSEKDPFQPPASFGGRGQGDAIVRGRLLLPGGSAAVGAEIRLQGIQSSQEHATAFGLPANWTDPALQTANSEGRFEFSFDPPRAFYFSMAVNHPSAAKAAWRWNELSGGSVLDLGDVELEPCVNIAAVILDASSNPVSAGWSVTAKASAPNHANGRQATSIKASCAAGASEILLERVPARRVMLEADTPSGGRIQPVAVDPLVNQTAHVELRYVGPDLSRRITVITSTQPFYNFYFAGFEVSATAAGAAPIQGTCNQSGLMAYFIDDCAPGSYDVRIDNPRFLPWSKSGVQPGEVVKAKLVGNATLQLHLSLDNGTPYLGAFGLRARFASSNSFPTSQSEIVLVDATKPPPQDLRIGGVIAADYEMTLEAAGFPPQKIAISGLAANEVRDVNVSLGSALSLRGRVLAADGTTPMAGVDLQLTRGDIAGHTLAVGTNLVTYQGQVPRIDQQIASDAQGEFVFDGLSGGHWTLRTAWGNYLQAVQTIDLSAAAEPLVIRQPASGMLSGHLLLPASVSLESTRLVVSLEESESRAETIFGESGNGLAPDGSFHFGPLPLGEARISLVVDVFDGESGYDSGPGVIHTAVIHDGDELQAEIDLRSTFPGRLRAHVTIDGPSASAGSIHWSLPNAANGMQGSGGRTVNSSGTAVLGGLKPGQVRVTYESKDKTWAWLVPQAVTIEPGQEQSLEIALHTTARDLRCVDAQSGAILANVEIEWRTAFGGEELISKARTDAAGLLHLRMPDQEIAVRCVGYAGESTLLSWGAGTGALSVSLQRAP
ncbi:MAG: hypothetical protein ABI054_06800, partial [Planctomycetota bacterium]